MGRASHSLPPRVLTGHPPPLPPHHHILYLNTIRFKAQSLWGRVFLVKLTIFGGAASAGWGTSLQNSCILSISDGPLISV